MSGVLVWRVSTQVEGQADDALALLDASGVKLIAQLLADEHWIAGQGRQGHGGGDALAHL